MQATVMQLVLLLCSISEWHLAAASVRQYYIAAVEIGWDYIHLDEADLSSQHGRRSKDNPQKFIKAVYREFTDSKYTTPKTRPAWTGIQGPIIHAQAGDKVVVHFKNLASQPYSISPVGITYWKQSEGVGYDDSTAGHEKEDDAVSPGGYYEYVWDISPKDGPTPSDPECLTYSYSSQVDTVRDINSGLIGALLICKSSVLTEANLKTRQAFVLLFAVFDESKSWYGHAGESRNLERNQQTHGKKEYHTINGYVNSTLPGLVMCQGRNYMFWHLIGIGTTPEIHSIQFQDHTLQVMDRRKFTMEVTPMTFITAKMKPSTVGSFLISCQIHAHQYGGMKALFSVENCPEPLQQLQHILPNDKNGDEFSVNSNEKDEDLFNTLDFEIKNLHPRSNAYSGVLVHYIAAEEVTWDYAPHLKPTDSKLKSRHLPPLPSYKYKKVVYVEYTDRTFTRRKSTKRTLFGPMLKGKADNVFHIIFKNLASRPYNIYPNGITKIYPMYKSKHAKDLRSMGVPPNDTFGYIWKLTDDGPLNGDPQCLTQLYQSTVSPERDVASGLVGMLLICKAGAFDRIGRLVSPDKDWSLVFSAFDENRSWYANENIQNSSQNSSSVTDVELYNSNVIYSVNGIMFSMRQFVMCQTDVIYWYVAYVGTQSDFLSIYFTGNLFEYQGLYQSVLTLFPMTGMTISSEMELIGEWEVSAFDGSLKSRGMSILYTVIPCDSGDLIVDHDEDDFDISDYVDQFDLGPRSSRPQNDTVLVKVCKKNLANNGSLSTNGTDDDVVCQLKRVTLASFVRKNTNTASEEEIPEDVLREIDEGWDSLAPLNETEGGARKKRQVVGNWTNGDKSLWDTNNGPVKSESKLQDLENKTEAEIKRQQKNEIPDEVNQTTEESNEILPNKNSQVKDKALPVEHSNFQDADQIFLIKKQIDSDAEQQMLDLLGEDNYTAAAAAVDNNTTNIGLSVMYDDYGEEDNSTTDMFDYMEPRSGQIRYRSYYIAAEEVTWDYGIRKPHQYIKPKEMRRGMRKFLYKYKKVVFRAYNDKDFQKPAGRGEIEEHLGIMGPFIRAEVYDVLTVVFMNKASRPYSFHLQGVYDRSQGAGIGQTHTTFAPPGVPGDPVDPGEARTYNWKITRKQGPTETEFDCKTGAYYSSLDKERDLHSGLIGPLVICKHGTLHRQQNKQPNVEEFSLLFHTFDETKSWYMEENLEKYCAPPCKADLEDPWYHISNKFAAINGYVAETLPGLLVAQYQRVRWHLLNVGNDGEYHAVQFHGLPLTVHTEKEHRQGVYNLFPGVFGTIEMRPSTVGTWLVECTIGDYQLAGMRAKLLVYNPRCIFPLGMKSGRIEDSQITASEHIKNWEPRLARLDQSGYINAWMGRSKNSWLQVDLKRPTLLHGIQTQGVSSYLRDNYISLFTISYSLDQESWTAYRGNNTKQNEIFYGNMDSNRVKENRFAKPFVARYVRIHPVDFVQKPALRLELLGCDVNSCSLPLGLQRGKIPDSGFKASSFHSSFFRSWSPSLARLHQGGSSNAWRPEHNNPHEWLQVDLGAVKRITGVVTQGAKSMMTEMMVTEFSVTISHDNHTWSTVLEENSQKEKIFIGNDDPEEEALSVFDPPLFGRFMRIHPRGWINDIALRLEVLGCDTLQDP